jgi:hypothetical protein
VSVPGRSSALAGREDVEEPCARATVLEGAHDRQRACPSSVEAVDALVEADGESAGAPARGASTVERVGGELGS